MEDEMVNKQNLWFVTLFSLILVLSVFYITMPGEELLAPVINEVDEERETQATVQVKESELITRLRVERDDARSSKVEELQKIINDSDSEKEARDRALSRLKTINETKAKEEQLENKLKEAHEQSAFVGIDEDDIRVVMEKDEHNAKLANQIMRLVQKEFKTPVNISVRFEA